MEPYITGNDSLKPIRCNTYIIFGPAPKERHRRPNRTWTSLLPFWSLTSIREERRCTGALSLSCGVFLLFLLEFGDNTSCSNIFTIVGQLLLNCDNTLLKYNGSSFAKISTTSSFDFSPRLKICFVFFSSLCIWFLSDNDRIPPSKFSVSVISL